MTVTDRTDASPEEFAARIAPFESAVTPPEVQEAAVLEEVARAIWEADPDVDGSLDDGVWLRSLYRRLAAAAVAAYRAQDGGAEEARKAGLVAVREMAFDWYCPSDERLPRVNCRECVAEVALDAALSERTDR